MPTLRRRSLRSVEGMLLLFALAVLAVGFFQVYAVAQLQDNIDPLLGLPFLLLPVLVVAGLFLAVHILLIYQRLDADQLILPLVALIFVLGLTLIFRLRDVDGVWQQITRGLAPGLLLMGILCAWPELMERIRRWAVPISAIGLLLPAATALIGVTDETGARLALKLGPLPAIQVSEILKVAMLIFLAWFIEREGEAAEGRAYVLFGRLRIPPVRYFLPGALFAGMATLALVWMSDFGAALILAFLFVTMLYAGFQSRTFATIVLIGLGFGLLAGLFLYFFWHVPQVIQNRFIAFVNPWSTAELVVNGVPTGVTISQGPGYQIQQAIYALVAGGITGTGLGYGAPQFIPLASSDFIYAALLEELGTVIGFAVLALFGILVIRILRVAVLLPPGQVFERLLLVGIGVHLFTQVFIMVGGTINLFPLTGVTVPFMSLGGSALLVNLTEIGMVLAVAQRLEARPQ